MSIYTLKEINSMIYNIQQLIEDGADQEQIEVLLNAQDILEMERGSKLESYAMVVKNLESNVNGIELEIKRLTERKRFMQNNINRLKEYMMETLSTVEGNRMKTEKFTFSFRKSSSVEITNENLVPSEFIKIEKKIDKAQIKNLLKQHELEFARLVESKNLQIK